MYYNLKEKLSENSICLLKFYLQCVIIIALLIKGVFVMAISYKKLWKLLIDKDIKKKDLVQMAGVSGYTLNKLNKGETVTTETLMKICVALECSFDDIMEIKEQEK